MTGKRCAHIRGFSLHGNIRIHGSNREHLERLCRYVARGPITQQRLRLLEDGRIHYKLCRPFHDGTRALVMDPLSFIGKLCALVPAPRQHLVTYHGILAPNALYRHQVVSRQGAGRTVVPRRRKNPIPIEEATDAERRRRYTFAELMN